MVKRLNTRARAAALIVLSCAVTMPLPAHAGNQAANAPQAGPAPGETLSESYRGSQRDNVEYQKVAPFKVFDNLFYVGPGFVSVWLIPTMDGLILVDAAEEPYVDHVLDGIRKVGFDPRDIKYILLTHGHLDHFGGAERIRQLSGARIATLEEDWQLIESFARAPARPNRPPALVPARDLVIKEGDTVTLGATSLQVYKLPGHTPGSPSFTFTVYDGGRPHKALIFGGPGPRGGVEGGQQFLASINRLITMASDVEVPVHVHSWLSSYPYPGGAIFERARKIAARKPGDPHPFVDNATWRAWLTQAQEGGARYVKEQGGATAAYAPPRTPHGQPDLQGIWQVLNTAAWDIQDHPARPGVPAGQGVVDGHEIPYQPWALQKREENSANRHTLDPETRCHMPGVPRVTYMPYPFQIVQRHDSVLFLYEYIHIVRSVYTNGTPHPPGPIDWLYMGDSRGRWEGDTLVVDVVHFREEGGWLDRAGNFHSDALHVVERYTPIGPDHLQYEVTIEDPKVFTRPWTMSMPLYRRKEPNVQLLEYECYAYQYYERKSGQ